METKKNDQSQQYKVYTREAAGENASKKIQTLGGELWYN